MCGRSTSASPPTCRCAARASIRAIAALARSIATVALRRLGTIRKALAERLDKGMPKRSGMLEWTLVVGAAQILFLDTPDHAAVDLAVRAARADAASAPFAGLANAVLRGIARDARRSSRPPIRSTTTRRPGSPRAGARTTAKRRRGPSPPPIARSRRSTSASRATLPAGRSGSAGSCCRPARCGSIPHKAVVDLEGYADGEWWVQDAAAALAGAAPQRPRRDARRRSLRRAGRQGAELPRPARPSRRSTARPSGSKMLAAKFERLKLHSEIVVADALAFEAPPFDAVAPRRALHRDRHHPPPSRRRLDQAAERPRPLVQAAGPASRQGDRADQAGRALVYCTCSLEPEEGEAQIAACSGAIPTCGARRSARRKSAAWRNAFAGRRAAHPALPTLERRPEAVRRGSSWWMGSRLDPHAVPPLSRRPDCRWKNGNRV